MFMSVDFPAPFSPIRPWIDPRATDRLTERFACTAPNRLSMPRSSSAGPGGPPGAWGAGLAGSTGLGRLVLGDGDPAGDDVRPGLVEALLHLRRDQLAVVLVERVVDAVLREAEDLRARLPRALPRIREHGVDGDVDPLDRGGEHASRVQVVLVAVAADAEEAGVGRSLHDA